MPEEKKEMVLDINSVKSEFVEFLKEKYNIDDVVFDDDEAAAEKRFVAERRAALKEARKPIKKLSEKLNKINWYIPDYDLSSLKPGDIVYTMAKVPGNRGLPYEICEPKLCVISAVRGSGEGATFYTYNYKTMIGFGRGESNSLKIVSEESIIAHPLTKIQAETMCAKFNFLSKQTYEECIKQTQKPKKKKNISKDR